MGIVSILLRAVTWWNGQTLNTQLFTWRKGVKVGEDDAGNMFYETKDSVKRWVIFNGESEATRVNPDWHGWLHYTVDETPDEANYQRRDWHQPHQINPTGTKDAHKPAGPADTASYASGYDSWKPE